MIHLTWRFSFWVFERYSFLIYRFILLVLCIYFNWEKMFCVQNLSNKQEWSLQLEKFRSKCWNFKTFAYLHSNPVINATRFYCFHFFILKFPSYKVIAMTSLFFLTRYSKSGIPDLVRDIVQILTRK